MAAAGVKARERRPQGIQRHAIRAKELHQMGASDTLSQAKKCVHAVAEACKGTREGKKPNARPKASWNVL